LRLNNIIKLIWENKAELRFGTRQEWENDAFQQSWVERVRPDLWNNKEGLYWFASSITLDELELVVKPQDLPNTGCDFGTLVRVNRSLLSGNLCSDLGLPVLYNGQRSQVFSRLRAHFHISEGTGALGIEHYPLSNHQWSAFVFHIGMVNSLQGLSGEESVYIRNLILSETGRCSLEAAWRSEYGWPVLCKK